MTRPARAFQGVDEGRLELDAVVGVLADRYTVEAGRPRTVRRRRLDTFDRRLRAAGLTLEHHSEPRARRVVLDGADGPSTDAVTGDLRWPAGAEVLRAGRVRDAVAPVAGIRALLVVSDERHSWRQLDLRDADGKTVVRVELDEPLAVVGGAGRVTVRALRGYDEHARRVDRLLTGLGLRPVEAGLAGLAGMPDGDDLADDVPAPVAADAPATALLAAALSGFLAVMRANLPGVLADIDTEFLHDFRVALRRTRSTLRWGREVLPAEFRSEWEPAFAGLGALTTPVRDLDVYLLGLPAMSGWLVAADATDLDSFGRHLTQRRAIARQEMVDGLRSARFRRLLAGWEGALVTLGGRATGTATGTERSTSAGVLGGRVLARASRKVVRDGAAIGAGSPADDLHRLRGRCKELRYALEVFAPVVDPPPSRRVVADLRGLQDVLGRFQDADVQRRALREFAEEMLTSGVPAAALLAMGELIAHLDAEQGKARREFDQAFTRFVRPSGRAPLHRPGGDT
ncbi:CHAD domain-containing protein [Pengzhenrongella frigida]|uniref:CHAD domain-containing protein n=1 Tax=Pengzhenrongella frigida TaxID=1259133 RepID=A0A4Q5MYQ3_9MICO|nr:CHAD domain-containing protein [Cellulomonas sp. HLT2-17]RYV50796.1 CHAD domain-containing protein [Cellulomonas sp. HLT2-17]